MWLNLIFLGIVVLIPFAAAILGKFDHNRTAILVYAAVIFVGESIVLILWQYLSRRAPQGFVSSSPLS